MSSTLKELARQLGVSPSTVSRALSGRELKRPSTRARVERIRALAAEAGYTPNSVARSLKTKRRQVVGLILPDIMNDYYATAATLAQQTLAGEGYRALLCVTYDDPAVEDAHLRVLMEERVAGIVVVPSPRPAAARGRGSWQDVLHGVPVVELVRQSGVPSADAVLIDDVDAGRQGTQHLIELGHRRIAVISGPTTLSTARQRVEGYRRALLDAGIAPDERFILSGAYRREAARVSTLRLLAASQRPTALIATSNELVVGVLQAFAAEGVRVPAGISLVGFGNPDWFELLQPALTTVALPIADMAMVAVRLLLRRVQSMETEVRGPELPAAISRYQAQLIVRQSTAPVPGSIAG